MKVFPTKIYNIELKDNVEKNIEVLKFNTLESDNLSTKLTEKEFIGKINGNHFEIISSQVGIGTFTVLLGDFTNDSVNIVAEVNKPFKVLISILFLLGIAGVTYNVYKIGFPKGLGMLIPLAMLIGLLRFVFLGVFFKVSSNLTFGKFSNLLNVKSTQNNS